MIRIIEEEVKEYLEQDQDILLTNKQFNTLLSMIDVVAHEAALDMINDFLCDIQCWENLEPIS